MPQAQPRPGIQHQLCQADTELVSHLQGLDLLLRLLPKMRMMISLIVAFAFTNKSMGITINQILPKGDVIC